ncbi:MAG: hypothetical protein Q8N53_13925, partial [Longimicrobiales bacterium]|nr:hypothetical protein [Longimicrobiales bacterium]
MIPGMNIEEGEMGLVRIRWTALVAAVALPAHACDAHSSSSPELLKVETLPALQVVESADIGGFS